MKRQIGFAAIGIVLCACFGLFSNLSHAEKNVNRNNLTVLTYNLWHGLNPVGFKKFQEYETEAQREARYQGFLRQVRALDPDILFLQEVNPVPAKSARIGKDLGMDRVYKVANAGIKIGSIGPPSNLYSGLAILAKKEFGLKDLGGRKLSGPPGYCTTAFSFQYGEFRYCHAASVTLNGHKVLLMNTHLHHGIEAVPELREAMNSLVEQEKIVRDRADEILNTINQASARRQSELKQALDFAQSLGFADAPTFFAGDFNATPGAPELDWLTGTQKFASVPLDDDPSKLLITWDAKRNANTQFVADFKPVNEFEAFVMEHFLPIVVGMSRRLDYVFHRGTQGWMEVRQSGLFGTTPFDGRMCSDHFGIYAKFVLPSP